MDAEPAITMRTYGLLAIPSLFDLASASLLILALMNIDASIWMLLRGGCIVFVAVMKRFVLLDHLTNQMWTGIFVIAVSLSQQDRTFPLCQTLPDSATRCHAWPHAATLCHTLPHFAQFAHSRACRFVTRASLLFQRWVSSWWACPPVSATRRRL